MGNKEVFYSYSKDKNGKLLTELMRVDREELFNKNAGHLNFSESFRIDAAAKDKLLNSANNMSLVNFIAATYPLSSGHPILALKEFVDSMLWFKSLDKHEFIGLENNASFQEEEIIKMGQVKEFQHFLKTISNQDFEFVTPAEGDKILKCQINNAIIPFPKIASTVTQSLQALYICLKKIDRATFAFIDEFDAYYHFRLAFDVCHQLFRQNAQVFLSSHNTYLMTNDLLRPDCNFILDRNTIMPLCDCTEKELRFGHNIEKLFRGNAFSAV